MESVKLPAVLTSNIFEVISSSENKIIAKCLLCVGVNKIYSGSPKATTNFLTHVRRKHPERIASINEVTRKSAKRTASYDQDEEKEKKLMSKPHTNPFAIAASGSHKKTISNEKCNELVIRYITQEMLPLSTVDKPSFREMIEGLTDGAYSPVCRQTLSKQVETRAGEYKEKVISIIATSDFVCTTADIWSTNNKSFFGVTAHIITLDTLCRKSFMLACRRIKFSHTHLEIAKTLNKIHKSFGIDNKQIVGTVTDNAKNFCKAFQIFAGDDKIELPPQLENDIEEVETVDLDFSQMNVCDELELDDTISLPTQFRCSSHTLSLIATTDIQKTISTNTSNLKKIYYSVFGKLTSVWNTVSRSTKASDEVEKICKKKLKIPCVTRWNSLFDCIRIILAVREYIDEICTALAKPPFKTIELEFLEEYSMVLKPLAIAIDVLQGEKNSYLGYVLPTILQILHSESRMVDLKFCSEIRNTIIKSIKTRFDKVLDFRNDLSRPYLFSTCSLPLFKLNWINKDKENEKYLFVKQLLTDEIQKEFVDNVCKVNSPVHQDGIVFDFMETAHADDLLENSAIIELLTYLKSSEKNILMLNSYPTVLKMFRKYNVILPSSAPVERMFSVGGQILTPRRNKLSD